MRYYLVAGEASGDLHGSNLMKALKSSDKNADFRFFGGDLMEAIGGKPVKHYREMAFMGIVNVMLNIRTIKKNMDLCKKDVLSYQPDVLILIDYPGFNLKIAEFAKQNNIKVFYYISPKLWAWKEYRVKKIRRFVDEMFTIFPFETAFYKKHQINVHYVGNPLMDAIESYGSRRKAKTVFLKENKLDERPMVALLAGSRNQEIKRTLPLMVKIANAFPDFQFVVAGVKSIDVDLYNRYLESSSIPVVYDQTYQILDNSYAALVASGTAALETALFKVPQTVIYKMEGGWLVDLIFRKFLFKRKGVYKIAGVSLPNIIMGKEFVREFIQNDMKFENVKNEMHKLLFDKKYRDTIFANYDNLLEMMGNSGCSERTAQKMTELLILSTKH